MADTSVAAPSTIPADWDDVTPEWMTAAVAARHPEARVAAVTVVERDDGTNRRARLGLEYAAGSGPEVVFAKAENDLHREVHARNGNLFNEALLYASGVPLPLDHPLPYAATVDRAGFDYVIVMEDVTLRGADPRDAIRPLTVDQVANGVRGLARLHRQYWRATAATHPALDWAQVFEPTEGWQVGLRARIPTGFERLGATLPGALAGHDTDRVVGEWARYLDAVGRLPRTLLHGDAHIGNTYVLPGDDVGFLDWQVTRWGHWSVDVGYFIQGSLTAEDRRRNEADLVEEYRAALGAGDGRPGRDEAWLAYRAAAAHGYALWLSTLGSDGYQRQEVSRALAERFSAAFAELEAQDAIDRLAA